jgi:hypothetical protein
VLSEHLGGLGDDAQHAMQGRRGPLLPTLPLLASSPFLWRQ